MVYLFLSKSFGTQLAPLGVLNALIHRNTRTHTQKPPWGPNQKTKPTQHIKACHTNLQQSIIGCADLVTDTCLCDGPKVSNISQAQLGLIFYYINSIFKKRKYIYIYIYIFIAYQLQMQSIQQTPSQVSTKFICNTLAWIS